MGWHHPRGGGARNLAGTLATRILAFSILASSVLVSSVLVSPAVAVTGFDPNGEGSTYPISANGRKTAVPTIRAARVDEEPIRVDGILNDPVWQRAHAGTGFSMHEPDRGGSPTEETVFKVAYDEDAVYFAVACFEKDPNLTSSTLTRRDRIDDSDLVSIYIDPYLDKTTGYNFRVNPDGVLQDQYVYEDGNTDRDWDAVWQAETHRNDEGWFVEMRVPFSSIRYRPQESMTWGLQVYRWMQGRGEDNGWVVWDRETRGFVSRFGTVTGIEGVRPPRQLEVVPYFVSRAENEVGSASMGGAGNFGADIKYGVTADLTLNATVQPDFGQVEADPAVLNLSPFETFFSEKRPFFIEGARFFQHPDFNLFYSRRIGTEAGENSRIRFASKLTGKTVHGISVAGLYAATDITSEGQGHNPFKNGALGSQYFVGRVGKEFMDGAHRINLMQTAAIRPGSDLTNDLAERRDAYTTGVDFDMNFHDRDYNVQGSFVGSIVQPSTSIGEARPSKIYGTGGALDVRKLGGNNRGGLWGRWEGDRLRLNDLGFLGAPDEVTGGFWLQRRLNGDGKSLINQGNINLNFWSSTLYAGRTVRDDAGNVLWSYDRGHHQNTGGNINAWTQFRNYWSTWWGVWGDATGTSRFETRGGPLMTNPARGGVWWGFDTDSRKKFQFELFTEAWWSVEGRRTNYYEVGVDWNQATNLSHSLEVSFADSHRDAQHIGSWNFDESLQSGANFVTPAGGVGIGGTSYVFGELDTRTFDITLRTDVLFNRNQSLELYVQPFLTVGTYGNARELVQPDTYDFTPFSAPGFDPSGADFNRASVNLNLVYRWEYRPGSTLFLVWTHARNNSLRRNLNPDSFNADLEFGNLFDVEPEDTFLAKLTYWFSI